MGVFAGVVATFFDTSLVGYIYKGAEVDRTSILNSYMYVVVMRAYNVCVYAMYAMGMGWG